MRLGWSEKSRFKHLKSDKKKQLHSADFSFKQTASTAISLKNPKKVGLSVHIHMQN
jgi:hypothetical protein